jgi:hypothetical protein
MTEKAFMQVVLDAARLLGWRCYHPFDSRRSAPGFPDICCVKPGRLIFIETKGSKGRVSPDQEAWIETLATVPGVTALIAWPDQWDEIEQALRDEEAA